MAPVSCPYADCTWASDEQDKALLAVLLQMHERSAHPAASVAAGPAAARTEKVKRPTVAGGGTEEEWAYFIQRWTIYKSATRIAGSDVVYQLLDCCEELLRRDLSRTFGDMSACDESKVLSNIKSLAVRAENVLVARDELHSARQDRDEPVRTFCARLKGIASTCRYSVQCSCETPETIDYSHVMVRDSLIRGIYDPEIKLSLLSEKDETASLDETVRYIEAREGGKLSAQRLQNVTPTAAPAAAPAAAPTAAGVSTFRKQQRYPRPTPSTEDPLPISQPCGYCGKPGHSRDREARRTGCPAYGHSCTRCGKLHHLENVCRSQLFPQRPGSSRSVTTQGARDNRHRTRDSATAVAEHEPDTFETLCSVSAATPTPGGSSEGVCIEHHVYNSLSDCWEKRPSDPQPTVRVFVRHYPSDTRALGVESALRRPTPSPTIYAVTDTGCQSCLAGTNLLHHLGLTKHHLTPVKLQMTAANDAPISICGALALRLSDTRGSGGMETRQLVYFTDSTEKFFLSRGACEALGVIEEDFPKTGLRDPRVDPVTNMTSCDAATSESCMTATCDCPRRQLPPPPPRAPPYPLTEENREKIEDWLLQYYSSSTFNVCSHQPLPAMEGPPLRLMVDPDAQPVAHHKPIPVPIHWQEDVKAGLDQDCRLGVIEEVPPSTPVTWCHRMVISPKKNGKPRRTVDLQDLNTHATRETHHTQSPFQQARAIPRGTKKTVCDAWNGYHAVPLHPDDRHLTTFITPWGRYRYRVAPQGYIASGDGYTKRFDAIVTDIPQKTKCVDDALLWSWSMEAAFHQTVQWLDTCGRHGIVQNPSKFCFARDVVDFAGFEITPTAVKPCPKILQSIESFPTPQNLTDVRSWFGLVNQVAYAFASADHMKPYRDLLKPGRPFIWTTQLEDIFQRSKTAILEQIKNGVEIFDKTRPTCLATDWSKEGLGYWLFQKHCNCSGIRPFCCRLGWRVVLVGSRFTHGAEARYAPVEGEALAVVDALNKARHFTLGCSDLIVAVDHRPLLKVLGDRSLEDIPNPRLRNLKEKSLRFRFRVVHIPGVRNAAADALSRHPVGAAEPPDLPDDVAAAFTAPRDPLAKRPEPIHETLPDSRCHTEEIGQEPCTILCASATVELIRSITWDDVRAATSSDPDMRALSDLIHDGFPSTAAELPPAVRPYHRYREKLNDYDGVLLYNDRVIIPPALRDRTLQALHAAHQGVTMMDSRAESSFFWPGMSAAIEETRSRCATCNRMAPSQPSSSPTPPLLPAYPFQAICADYFTHQGHHYLVAVDRYSNWPIVEESADGSKGLITALRRIFVTFGISDELSSDGGPEFTATATQQFLRDWGVRHRLSSVGFPHSNCRAEIAVKTIKRLLSDNSLPNGSLDTDRFQRAVLQYRNTPDRDTRLSPAQVIFGRPIRDFIPIHPGKYQPHSTWRETLANREEALRNRHMKAHERLSEHTRVLPPLTVGDTVRLQNLAGPHPTKWDKTGIVIEVRQFDQYVVKVDGSGRVTIRNRKHLRSYTPYIRRPPLAVTWETRLPRTAPTQHRDEFDTKTLPYVSIQETRQPPGVTGPPSAPDPRHIPAALPQDDVASRSPSTPPPAPTPEPQNDNTTRTELRADTPAKPRTPTGPHRGIMHTGSPTPPVPCTPPPASPAPRPRYPRRCHAKPKYLDEYVYE